MALAQVSVAQRINAALRRVPPWAVYVAGALPVLWLIWQTAQGGLGVDPVREIEHRLGLMGLQMIVAGLCVTPLRRLTGVNLIRFRRAIGLIAFAYVALHLLVWVTLDLQFRWGEIGTALVKRPYIVMGAIGFLLLLPLAVTSNSFSVRRMGPVAWQRLHWLVYPAALAGAVHFLWLVKTWPLEPALYLAAILLLLGLRLWHRVRG